MLSENATLVVSLVPLYIFLKATGLALFSLNQVENNDRISYFNFKNSFVHLFHIAYVYYAVKNTHQKFIAAPDLLQKVYTLVFLINAFALIGVNIVWDKLKNRQFLLLLRKMNNLDKELLQNNIILDYNLLKRRSMLIICSETFVYTLFNIDTATIFLQVGNDVLTVIMDFIYYAGLHFMQITMTGKCFTLFAIVENILKQLNLQLSHEDVSPEIIRTVTILYHKTYVLVLDINQVIAFQLLVPFCVTFIMAVYHIYYQIVNSDLQESQTVLVWLTTILLKIIIVIVQIQRASDAVCIYNFYI